MHELVTTILKRIVNVQLVRISSRNDELGITIRLVLTNCCVSIYYYKVRFNFRVNRSLSLKYYLVNTDKDHTTSIVHIIYVFLFSCVKTTSTAHFFVRTSCLSSFLPFFLSVAIIPPPQFNFIHPLFDFCRYLFENQDIDSHCPLFVHFCMF